MPGEEGAAVLSDCPTQAGREEDPLESALAIVAGADFLRYSTRGILRGDRKKGKEFEQMQERY